MFVNGLIAGFLSRADAEALLVRVRMCVYVRVCFFDFAARTPGCQRAWLVHCASVRHVAGSVRHLVLRRGGARRSNRLGDDRLLCGVSQNGVRANKHYLVTPQDTSTKKSLAEFMRTHNSLVYLLQVRVTRACVCDLCMACQVSVESKSGKRVVTRVIKDRYVFLCRIIVCA
jgi:hypothetical protein